VFSDAVILDVAYVHDVTFSRKVDNATATWSVLCVAECNPQCTYKWLDKQGDEVHVGEELDLSFIKGAGNFTCQVGNDVIGTVKSASTYIFHDPLTGFTGGRGGGGSSIIVLAVLLAVVTAIAMATVIYIACTRCRRGQKPLTMTRESQTDVVLDANVRASGVYDMIPDTIEADTRYQRDTSFHVPNTNPYLQPSPATIQTEYGNDRFHSDPSSIKMRAIPDNATARRQHLNPGSLKGMSPQRLDAFPRKNSLDGALPMQKSLKRPITQDFDRLIEGSAI
jgi:hypothetical protein